MSVPAHEILVGYNSRCFQAPGPGRCFSEDDLNAVLANADAVQVVSDANGLAEVSERIARARQILGRRGISCSATVRTRSVELQRGAQAVSSGKESLRLRYSLALAR
jgi:hypothetical protein